METLLHLVVVIVGGIGIMSLIDLLCEIHKTRKRAAIKKAEQEEAKPRPEMLDLIFVAAFEAKAREAHNTATEKGWHDKPEASITETLMLKVTELAEACEAIRKGNPPDKHCPEFRSLEVELADCIIRIMDTATHNRLRVAEAVAAKMKFNKTRSHRHGGKTL